MLDRVRDVLYRAISSKRGDGFAPTRVSKDAARRLNATLGWPLASMDDLARRKAARLRLAELKTSSSRVEPPRAEAAPVLVYFEAGRNERELARIEELLTTKSIDYRRLDVAGDEATIEFVTRRAGLEKDELPVVFVADVPVGGYEALVRADVSGELARRIRGG